MSFLRRNSQAIARVLTWSAPVAVMLWWLYEAQFRQQNILLVLLLAITCMIAPFFHAVFRYRQKARTAREASPESPPGRLYLAGRFFMAMTLPLMLSAIPVCLVSAFRLDGGGSGWCFVLVPIWWGFYAWIAPAIGLLLVFLGRNRRDSLT